MEPVLTAVVPWAEVRLNCTACQAVLAPELVVAVRLRALPVVKELPVIVAAVVVVPVKAWVRTPAPEANARFLPAAIVVSPLRLTAPVPVLKAPAPTWEKLPEARAMPVAPVIAPAEISKVVVSTAKTAEPPPKVRVPVEVPVLMLTALLEEALRLTVPPLAVKPAEPVKSPAEVMAPAPEVEILPEVVMASPALIGDKVVPVLSHQP